MQGRVAIIGGSQAYSLLQSGAFAGERMDPINTPFGNSQPVYRMLIGGRDMLLLSRHGEKGYEIAAPWVNYRANIWALKELGVEKIVSWSGPGAIDQSYQIGQFVIPSDVIDETKNRAHTFFEGAGWGFVRQNPVFCPHVAKAISHALTTLNLEFQHGGTYVCTEGPRLETPAEIKKFGHYGGDLVGMTLIPEVFLARELEMCYASICYVTNYAEGLRDRPFIPGVLFEGLLDAEERSRVDNAVAQFPRIVEALAVNLQESGTCHCDMLMERYRRRGDIGSDWHTWITSQEREV